MKSLIPALFTVGALMVLFGAAVYITGWEPAPYVYTIGRHYGSVGTDQFTFQEQ